ncbi:hypothetical protein N9X32_03345 [Pseudomonadales bacterium]|nr:hypothetical protein [Pseudomonadales bacterium]
MPVSSALTQSPRRELGKASVTLIRLNPPKVLDRRFVLQPLQDIAPAFRFPGINEGLSVLIQRAPSLVIALWD